VLSRNHFNKRHMKNLKISLACIKWNLKSSYKNTKESGGWIHQWVGGKGTPCPLPGWDISFLWGNCFPERLVIKGEARSAKENNTAWLH
jgi:hypothetical protein